MKTLRELLYEMFEEWYSSEEKYGNYEELCADIENALHDDEVLKYELAKLYGDREWVQWLNGLEAKRKMTLF